MLRELHQWIQTIFIPTPYEESEETPSTEESEETPSTEESEETPSTEESEETPSTEESEETPSTEEKEGMKKSGSLLDFFFGFFQ
jgi:hypothetical protein